MVYLRSDIGVRPRKPLTLGYQGSLWPRGAPTWPPDPQPTSFPETPQSRKKKRWVKHNPRWAVCNSARARREFREYLLTSSLHGLRYIGEPRLTWLERFFWLCAFSLSMLCAAYFIFNVYDKWQNSPMIVSVNPVSVEIQEIPFPAVTVCNVNQARRSVAERIITRGDNKDRKLLESVCNVHNETAQLDLDSGSNVDWDYFRQFLITVTQPCAELMAGCMWRGRLLPCFNLFIAALTDEGLCCTFNAVHRNLMFTNPRDVSDLNLTIPFPAVDWTPERGYPSDAPLDGFPWRPAGVGANLGLTLVLNANVDDYYCTTTSTPGFKILMHNPTEQPKIAEFGDRFSPGFEYRVVIKPQINDASPQTLGIPISKRRCVFADEKKLLYLRTYSEKNCLMECESTKMVEECQCVLYFMPKNRTTRICGKMDASCYLRVKELLEDQTSTNASCRDCLPSCAEVQYEAHVSSGRFDPAVAVRPDLLTAATSTPEYFRKNMAVLHYFFDENTFVRYTKGEIFGLTEFISSTGGLLGLCMGFSVMSLVEICYYISLRAACRAYRRPGHQGQPHQPFVP